MHKEIGALTGLRGIAALWVFAYHTVYWTNQLDPATRTVFKLFSGAGYLGVDLFFVLSGFVLALNYGNAGVLSSWNAYASFLWKRIARIWPVHVVTLGLTALTLAAMAGFQMRPAHAIHMTTAGLLQSLSLTHAWTTHIGRVWNVPAWSLSAEWAAYLAFPFTSRGGRADYHGDSRARVHPHLVCGTVSRRR